MIEAIIALDEAYEAGDLDEGEYLLKRDSLKSELESLMKDQEPD